MNLAERICLERSPQMAAHGMAAAMDDVAEIVADNEAEIIQPLLSWLADNSDAFKVEVALRSKVLARSGRSQHNAALLAQVRHQWPALAEAVDQFLESRSTEQIGE